MADEQRSTADPLAVAQARGIDAALQVLLGMPLCFIGRAATLLWVHFGRVRIAPTRRDPTREAGEYAIHTEAPWRILGPNGIVTGRHDLRYTAGEPELDFEGDKTRAIGSNRCDERLEELRQLAKSSPLVVQDVSVDAVGTLRMQLSDAYSFEIIPVDSTTDEQWRFFRPGATETPHLVVTTSGMGDG